MADNANANAAAEPPAVPPAADFVGGADGRAGAGAASAASVAVYRSFLGSAAGLEQWKRDNAGTTPTCILQPQVTEAGFDAGIVGDYVPVAEAAPTAAGAKEITTMLAATELVYSVLHAAVTAPNAVEAAAAVDDAVANHVLTGGVQSEITEIGRRHDARTLRTERARMAMLADNAMLVRELSMTPLGGLPEAATLTVEWVMALAAAIVPADNGVIRDGNLTAVFFNTMRTSNRRRSAESLGREFESHIEAAVRRFTNPTSGGKVNRGQQYPYVTRDPTTNLLQSNDRLLKPGTPPVVQALDESDRQFLERLAATPGLPRRPKARLKGLVRSLGFGKPGKDIVEGLILCREFQEGSRGGAEYRAQSNPLAVVKAALMSALKNVKTSITGSMGAKKNPRNHPLWPVVSEAKVEGDALGRLRHELIAAWGKTPTAEGIMASLDATTPEDAAAALHGIAAAVLNAQREVQEAVEKVRRARALAEGNRNACSQAWNAVAELGHALAGAMTALGAAHPALGLAVPPGLRAPRLFPHLAPDLSPCYHAFAPWGGWGPMGGRDHANRDILGATNPKYRMQVRRLVLAAPLPDAIKTAARQSFDALFHAWEAWVGTKMVPWSMPGHVLDDPDSHRAMVAKVAARVPNIAEFPCRSVEAAPPVAAAASGTSAAGTTVTPSPWFSPDTTHTPEEFLEELSRWARHAITRWNAFLPYGFSGEVTDHPSFVVLANALLYGVDDRVALGVVDLTDEDILEER